MVRTFADVDWTNPAGQSALLLAVIKDKLDVVKELIKKRADVNLIRGSH